MPLTKSNDNARKGSWIGRMAFVGAGAVGVVTVVGVALQIPEVQRWACPNLGIFCAATQTATAEVAQASPAPPAPQAGAPKQKSLAADPAPAQPPPAQTSTRPDTQSPAAPPVTLQAAASGPPPQAAPVVLTSPLAVFLGHNLPVTTSMVLTDAGADAARAFEADKLSGLAITFRIEPGTFDQIECLVEAKAYRASTCSWTLQGDLLELQSRNTKDSTSLSLQLRKAGGQVAGRARWNGLWFAAEAPG